MDPIGKLLGFFAERGAKGKDYDALATRLEDEGKIVAAKMAEVADTPHNRHQAGHMIGIERWGQSRLRTLLGEPLVMDEYDGYRPNQEESMAALTQLFITTRAGTIALLRSLQQAGIPLTKQAPHNQLGPLSVGGWVVYLTQHATRERIVLR
jgi:hypothetical protein